MSQFVIIEFIRELKIRSFYNACGDGGLEVLFVRLGEPLVEPIIENNGTS